MISSLEILFSITERMICMTNNKTDSIKSYLTDLTNDSINSVCDSLDIIRDNTLSLLNYLNPSYFPHYIRTIVNKSNNDFSIVFDYIYEHDDFEIFVSDSLITINYYSYSSITNNVSVYSKVFLINDNSFNDSIPSISSDNFSSLSTSLTNKLFLNNINSHNISKFAPIQVLPINQIASTLNSIFSSNDNSSNIIQLFNLNLLVDNDFIN